MEIRIFFVAMLMIISLASIASAVPTTLAVTGISAEQVTFSATGGNTVGWFVWGYGNNYYWTTMNQTVSGAFSDIQVGAPMLTGTTYNVKACDVTGCGDAVPFIVPNATMLPITNYGLYAKTIWKSGMNITQVANIILTPYAQIMSDPLGTVADANSIIWGIFFFVIFVGYWLRGNGIMLPSIMAIVSGGALFSGTLALGISPAFMNIGFPLLIVGLAGVFFSWFSK